MQGVAYGSPTRGVSLGQSACAASHTRVTGSIPVPRTQRVAVEGEIQMSDNTKVITCRTHGGTFRVPVRRGRPPVNCTPENKCRKPKPSVGATAPRSDARAKADSAAIRGTLTSKDVRDATAVAAAKARALQDTNKPAQSNANGRTVQPLGLTKALQAKAQLEALGWQAQGSKAADKTTVTATRGIELLVITWDTTTGTLMTQDYNLWNITVGKGKNGMPAHRLPFDPEEMSDADLVRELTGMKVTWWNTLAQGENSDVIQAGTIKIERSYEANGDEVYGDRIVKFIGYGGGGFRAFRVAALMKVG